jgi:hypothetical protein
MKNKVLEIVNNHNSEVFIENFVRYMPQRLDLAIALDMDKQTRSCCNNTDYVDYHYRKYLSGQSRNLKRTFFEVRRFLDNGHLDFVIVHLIESLKEFIMEQEFYELMPRLESSFKKILKLMATYRPQGIRGATPPT